MIVLLDQFGQLATVCLHLSQQQSGGKVDLARAGGDAREIKRLRARVAELERQQDDQRGSRRTSKISAVTPSVVRGLLKRSSALSQRIAEGEVAINSLLGLAERSSSRLELAQAELEAEVAKRQEVQSRLVRLQALVDAGEVALGGGGGGGDSSATDKTPSHGKSSANSLAKCNCKLTKRQLGRRRKVLVRVLCNPSRSLDEQRHRGLADDRGTER